MGKNLLQEADERINYNKRSAADQLARKLRFSSKVLGDWRTDVFSFVVTFFFRLVLYHCYQFLWPNHVVISLDIWSRSICHFCDWDVSDETTKGFLVPHHKHNNI